MATTAEAADGARAAGAAAATAQKPGGDRERLHSTVRLNQFTLRFEDAALEGAYRAALHPRKKALWLRSLVPAAASHVLFGTSDCLDHPVENLLVTLPARLLLVVFHLAMFMLVRWDLVRAHERTMLIVSMANGLATLFLYSLQRPALYQWDALFIVFGLSFYTVPKITPLGYVSCFYGSWATALVYAGLSFYALPPPRLAESAMGMLYCTPAIWVFTTIAYYAEYNARERFVLRRRLRSESISLAVACTPAAPSFIRSHPRFSASDDRARGAGAGQAADPTLADQLVRALSLSSFHTGWITNHRTASYLVALGLWAAFTLGGWTSLPDGLKFVDQDTGWAWFSHCAGVTVFLLVMTRRLLWLMIVPLGGAFVLWMLTLTMPASWIIISAHSVGYGLLLASVVIALGVFSWFMCAWNELVAFLTRTCFLFPQLRVGMETDFPLLVKIVSEYTASFDPQILSARRVSPPVDAAKQEAAPSDGARRPKTADVSAAAALKPHADGPPTSNSRRRRVSTAHHESRKRSSDDADVAAAPSTSAAACGATSEALGDGKREHIRQRETHPIAEAAGATDASRLSALSLPVLGGHETRMVSALPSFSPGKCFFCSKNAAEHYVPVCGMWGKWTYWRMSQQHPGLASSSLSILPSATLAAPANRHAVAMCTSYYDLQHRNAELEARVGVLESESRARAERLEKSTREFERELAHVQQELHATQEKHAQERLRVETQHRDKLADVLREANRAARQHKLEVKRVEAAGALALAEARSQAREAQEEADAQRKEAQQQLQELARVRAELGDAKRRAAELGDVAKHRERRLRAVSDSSGSLTCDDDAAMSSSSPTTLRSERSPLALDASFTSATSAGLEDDCEASSSPAAGESPAASGSSLVALPPSRRLPYANWLEIEGLRESAGAAQHDVDYAARWRDWQQPAR